MKRLTFLFGIILLISVGISSCKKKDPVNNDPAKGMNDLIVSSDFNWKTTKTVDVTIQLPNDDFNKIVKIFSLDASTLYYIGYANSGNMLTTKVTIPTSITTVRIIYGFDATYDPILADAESNIAANFNGLKSYMSDDDCDFEGLVTYTRSEWGSDGSGAPGDIRDANFDSVFPNGMDVGDSENYKLHFEGSSNVEDYLSDGHGGNEVLTQNYNNPHDEQGGAWAAEITACMMNVHFDDQGYIGTSGKTWKLKELIFKSGEFEDLTVEAFLDMATTALGGGDMNGHTKNDYKHAAKAVNESFRDDKGHGDESDLTCPNGGSGNDCGCEGGIYSLKMRYTGDSEALVEVIEEEKHNGGGATLYTGTVAPNGEFTATGGSKNEYGRFQNKIYFYVDGELNTEMHVSCSVDLFTGDTYGDFMIIEGYSSDDLPLCVGDPPPPPVDPPAPPSDPPGTTNVNQDGCLAYEDLWPGKGDYDFNDLIINYEFTVSKDEQDRVLNITGVFTIYAFGASYHNGFGFILPNVDPDQLISVSGYSIESGSIYNLASNGLEDSQSKATVIVYDDSYNIMPHPGSGIGVNTEESAPYVEPQSVTIHMVFFENGSFASGGSITYDELSIGDFNPFIIVNQERAVEVHLLDLPPSDLADQNLLGTFDDNSNPAQHRYYTTSTNLPWAINLPVLFEYPIEKQDIVGAYLKFADWAESGGTLYTDWYEDISGYRNNALIYTH